MKHHVLELCRCITVLCHFRVNPLPFRFWLQVKHSKTSASSYGHDFQELIGTYNASRNFRGKGQTILHEVEPESESSSYDSLDDSASDDEEEVPDVKINKLAKSLVKENTEHELDQYPGVDDFDGNGQIFCY
jgi:Werner syndrome ATP-dependent helicase